MGRRRTRPQARTRCEPVGRTIKDLRPMTDDEAAAECWHIRIDDPPIVIELDDGSILYPARDPEGNGPGALFGRTVDDEPVRFSVRTV